MKFTITVQYICAQVIDTADVASGTHREKSSAPAESRANAGIARLSQHMSARVHKAAYAERAAHIRVESATYRRRLHLYKV